VPRRWKKCSDFGEDDVKSVFVLLAAALSIALGADRTSAQATGVERLYVIDCGTSVGPDKSRWTPDVDVGKPLEMVGNCYLIRHRQGWMLWDTGVSDDVASMPNGRPGQSGSPHWRRSKTLAGEIEKLGLKPSDIKYLAVSHTHPDHIGNVELFPQSMLLVQRAEYDWPSPFGPRFKPAHPVTKLDGDRDVFGDGSLTIMATPGHTPGHQVLLVKLPKFGPVLLSGDAVHIQESWDKRYVPSNNVDREQTLASYQRIADVLAEHKAQLWINHDAPQRATLKLSPEYYE
jgi:glyoxylase-like metal-dependent hydrolase (beta-lactamase superfamily II)